MNSRRVVLVRPTYNRAEVTRRAVHVHVQGKEMDKASGDMVVGSERSPSIEGSHSHPLSPNLKVVRKEKAVEVSSVLEQANKLTKQQRQELLDLLALNNQLSSKAAGSRDLEMWVQALQTALHEATGSSDADYYGSVLIKRSVGSTVSWRPVESFMASSKLKELRVNERQAVYYLLARLLVEHASYVSRSSGAPLSPKLVANCTTSLAGVFETSFPGYLAAGLAPMVARQLQAGA